MDTAEYSDIFDRMNNGLQVRKNNWDIEHVVLPMQEPVKKYTLGWDKQNAAPEDNALIDRLFQAGMEMALSLTSMGTRLNLVYRERFTPLAGSCTNSTRCSGMQAGWCWYASQQVISL